MLRRLRDERGLSLLLSLLVMSTLSVTTAGMIAYTSAGSRTASIERSSVSARAIAEAGLNNALAILNQALDPKTASLLAVGPQGQKRTFTFLGGTAEVWGTYGGNADNGLWTIHSTGTVPNPTGGAPLQRTLSQTVEVHGVIEGGTVGAWSRMHHDDPRPDHCLVIEDVEIPVPLSSRGCIELEGNARITGAATTVDAATTVTLKGDSGTDPRAPSDDDDDVWGWGDDSDNVHSSNGDHAETGMSGNSLSDYLYVTDFDFGIPANATIKGIRVEIERSASVSDRLRDEDVRLIRSGWVGTTNKAVSAFWGTTDATATYGDTTSDTWGSGLTAAQINGSSFGVRLRVRNTSSSSRTARVDYVRITVGWEVAPTSSIGAAGANIAQARVGTSCKYGTQPAHSPCSATDHVWAGAYPAPQTVQKPTIDLDYWYRNARPGPARGCDEGGKAQGGFDFDNNYSAANPHPDSSLNQGVQDIQGRGEITPKTFSYSCHVTDAVGNLLGELSWNHQTRVLRIKGTIYIDGDFRFDDDGTVVHYQGRGIIYATGNLEFDELVCAGGQYPADCSSSMSSWDPTQNLLTVLSGGMPVPGSPPQPDPDLIASEFDQGAPPWQGGTQNANTPSGLQGIIYSNGDCRVWQNFLLSGPIICDEIVLPTDPVNLKWPTYNMWPSLGSLVEGQQYGSIGNASDYALVPGNITG